MDLVSQKKHIPEHYSEFCKPKPIIRIHILLGADDDHNLCFPYGALVMCFPMHKCYYFSALLKGESFSLPLSASLEPLTLCLVTTHGKTQPPSLQGWLNLRGD